MSDRHEPGTLIGIVRNPQPVSAATQSASSGSVRLTKFGSEASAVAPDGTGLLPQKGRYIYEVLCSNIQKWQWPRGLNRRSFGNALRISRSKIDVSLPTQLISDE